MRCHWLPQVYQTVPSLKICSKFAPIDNCAMCCCWLPQVYQTVPSLSKSFKDYNDFKTKAEVDAVRCKLRPYK